MSVGVEMKIVSVKLQQEALVVTLQQCSDKLSGAEDDVILDFSSVERIDPAVLTAMAEFADTAEDKAVNVVLSGVSVAVYRVLKLARLAQRFSLVS